MASEMAILLVLLSTAILLLLVAGNRRRYYARTEVLGLDDEEWQAWIAAMAVVVSSHLESDGDAPFAWAVQVPEQPGEPVLAHFYESVTELVGGKEDGAEVFDGFFACLSGLAAEFDYPPHLTLCCSFLTCLNSGLSPYVLLEGKLLGKDTRLYLHVEPLPGASPALRRREDGSTEEVSEEN